ncbi:siderophore-interacting protein [Plantibacter flavus]|uniref:siderophore-interacting protein n=1 Tax=Plantibacter flavus TaxID=150123 RepID=UPI003F142307
MSFSIHRAVVTAVRTLTPGMVRVTFGGDGIADYPTTGIGDEYVRLFFPPQQDAEPVLPHSTGESWAFEDDVTPSQMRTYTIRAVDRAAGTVDIDFVVHDGGVAAAWALRAAPGNVVGITSPTGLYDPPADLEWQILLADATGLPAAARIAEQTPDGVRTRIVIEVGHVDDVQEITGRDLEVSWVIGGNGHGPSCFDEVVRDLAVPEGVGYIWFAGETSVMRGVRKQLRHVRKLPNQAYKTIGYWTVDVERWVERWNGLDEATRAEIDALWDGWDAPGTDQEAITDAYHEQLERLGL